MTVRFANHRLFGYIIVFGLSGTVLGLSGHFASIFLPNLHRDFTVFALIAPSVTILSFLLMLQWAQPTTEALQLAILGILWLTMGSWSTDIIGHIQCDTIGGDRMRTNTGTISSREYCYEMKTIQAFSWALFCLFVLFLGILFSLTTRAQALGRPYIWYEPIRELPWFGEWPGYYNTYGGPHPAGYPMAQQQQYPTTQYIPGQSVLVQPGTNGQPTTITNL